MNKPAGIVVYANRGGGHGIMTVRAGLPFALTPPQMGTYATLRRPQPVHRLDKPTSGLLLVAKTKPAMVHLSLQFRDRKVKKTYVAAVNGIPPEPKETAISSIGAYELGVDVDPNSSDKWQLIDHPLDEKSAVTIWRALRYSKSLKANENYLTLVELKPKTGRYHQLRRHMVSGFVERHTRSSMTRPDYSLFLTGMGLRTPTRRRQYIRRRRRRYAIARAWLISLLEPGNA